MRTERFERVITVAVVAVATLSLTSAGSSQVVATQPDFSCRTDASRELVAVHGIAGHAEISVDTARSKHGHITAYVFSDFGEDVHSTDGATHLVTGTVSLQLAGQTSQRPARFTLRATPDSDAHGGEADAELHGTRFVGQRIRAVVHVLGHRYVSGWVTVGHGEPSCDP